MSAVILLFYFMISLILVCGINVSLESRYKINFIGSKDSSFSISSKSNVSFLNIEVNPILTAFNFTRLREAIIPFLFIFILSKDNNRGKKNKNQTTGEFFFLFGLDKSRLRKMMDSGLTVRNFNEYGRFSELKATVDKQKAKNCFEDLEGKKLPQYRVNIKVDDFLQKFILEGGFEMK